MHPHLQWWHPSAPAEGQHVFCLHLLQRLETHLLLCISPSTRGCLLLECASSDMSGLLGEGPSVPGMTAHIKLAVGKTSKRSVRGGNGKGDKERSL